MKRGGPLVRRTPLRQRPTPNEIPPEVRTGIARRHQGWCEGSGPLHRGAHLHHRKPRRHRDHRPCNLLYLCWSCHREAHRHPAARQDGRPLGRLLRSGQVPEDEPVLYRGHWVLLDDDYHVTDWRGDADGV